VEHAIKV